MNCFDSVSAMSVDRFDAVSVMYWLIHRGSLARLSARANRCARRRSRARQQPIQRTYGAGEKTNLIGEHHEPPVGLSAQDTPDALCGVPHGVEAQELGFANSVGVSQVLQPRLQNAALGVLVWYTGRVRMSAYTQSARTRRNAPEHDDRTPVVVVEIDALRDLATRNRQKHCSAAIVARLQGVRKLDEPTSHASRVRGGATGEW